MSISTEPMTNSTVPALVSESKKKKTLPIRNHNPMRTSLTMLAAS